MFISIFFASSGQSISNIHESRENNACLINIGDQTVIKQKKPLKISDFSNSRVELEGFEPSSKQGNHTLSTCLFQPLIFELWQDLNHQPQPYPLKFHHSVGAHDDYFRFNRTALPKSFGTTAFERCLVPSPCDGIKPVIYCTSIRQRERNCFRQINF